MPMYEYRAVEDGELITLLRSMREADDPVEDPAGKGRTFERVHSTFMVTSGAAPAPGRASAPGGGCACGNPHGPCHR